jgi:hypothetical protein
MCAVEYPTYILPHVDPCMFNHTVGNGVHKVLADREFVGSLALSDAAIIKSWASSRFSHEVQKSRKHSHEYLFVLQHK